MQVAAPVVRSVYLVTGMGHQLLNEIARATAVCHRPHVAAREEFAVLQVGILAGRAVQVFETVEHDVVIETRVAVFERMIGVEARTGVGDGKPVGHAIHLHEIGCRLVNHVVVGHYLIDLRTEYLRGVPVRAVVIGRRTTEDGFYRARHLPVLLAGIEDVREACGGIGSLFVIVNILILELGQRVLRLSRLHQTEQLSEGFGRLLGIFAVIVIGLTVLRGAEPGTILHQRTCRPQVSLAQIAQSHDLIDTQVVLSLRCGSGTRAVPVDGQQVGRLAEVGRRLVCTRLIGEAGQVEFGLAVEVSVHVGQPAEELHQLGVPPGTEEIELTGNHVFLFFGCSNHLVKVGQAQVSLADTIPGVWPKRVFKLVG